MENWKQNLNEVFQQAGSAPAQNDGQNPNEVAQFIQGTLVPTLTELQNELARYGRQVQLVQDPTSAALVITNNGQFDLEYRVRVTNRTPHPAVTVLNEQGERATGGGYFRHEITDYTIDDLPPELIINYFVEQYRHHLNGGLA